MTPAPQVLYVTYDGLLEPLGASQVLPYVAGLTRRGFRIEILSFEKPADLDAPGARREMASRLEAQGVDWTPLRYHKRPSLPATGWDVLAGRSFVTRWAKALQGGPGLVHARGYLPALMGRGGQRHGARLLFDMRGFWVDERIEAGYWSATGAAARMGRWAERSLLGTADHLILLTERAAARLPSLAAGGEVPPWTVVPTCVDLDRFRPLDAGERQRVRARLGVGDGPVLVHTGTLTGWYDGPRTMAVARSFVEQTGGTFVVLTRDTGAAERLARETGVAARVLSVSPAEVPAWLQVADAGLALVRCLPSKEASFPTKVGEYLATGLAVLSTPVGDLEALEDGVSLRLLREGEAPEPAARWLVDAVGAPGRSTAARGLAEAHLGLEEGVAALARVYRDLGVEPEGAA